jgi:hypothetical protein
LYTTLGVVRLARVCMAPMELHTPLPSIMLHYHR